MRVKAQGVIPVTKDMDIIDEGFNLFRLNVLFKNYSIDGPADKLLVYIFVCLSQCFKLTEQEYVFIYAEKCRQELKKD